MAAQPAAPRDRRPIIYAIADLAFAALYVVVNVVAPNRHPWAAALMWMLPIAALGAGVAMLVGGRRAWWTGVGGCAALLALAVVLLALIVWSAAFLAGVYGAFGQAAAAVSLVAAALVIELVALLPALQLRYLLSPAGRRAFARSAR